jgi:hypothetical protein
MHQRISPENITLPPRRFSATAASKRKNSQAFIANFAAAGNVFGNLRDYNALTANLLTEREQENGAPAFFSAELAGDLELGCPPSSSKNSPPLSPISSVSNSKSPIDFSTTTSTVNQKFHWMGKILRVPSPAFKSILHPLDGGIVYTCYYLAGFNSKFMNFFASATSFVEIVYVLAFNIACKIQSPVLYFHAINQIISLFIIFKTGKKRTTNNATTMMEYTTTTQLLFVGLETIPEAKKKYDIVNDGPGSEKAVKIIEKGSGESAPSVIVDTSIFHESLRHIRPLVWAMIIFYLCAGWLPWVIYSTVESFRQGYLIDSAALFVICFSKPCQVGYAVGSVISSLYMLTFVTAHITNLNDLVLTEAERGVGLDFDDVLNLAAAVQSTFDKTRAVCVRMKPLLINYAVYGTIAVIQVMLGVIMNYATPETEAKLLVPVWTVIVFFGIGTVFISIVSALGYVNIKMKRLLDALSYYLVTIRVVEGVNLKNSSQEKKEERQIMGATIDALLKLDPNVANLFGMPITTRLLGAILGQAGFMTFVILQFMLLEGGQMFSVRFLVTKDGQDHVDSVLMR